MTSIQLDNKAKAETEELIQLVNTLIKVSEKQRDFNETITDEIQKLKEQMQIQIRRLNNLLAK